MSLTRADMNIVHEDENWRQRISSEEQAASNWKGNWGFLKPKEAAQYVDPNMGKDELDLIVSTIGPCYQFLEKQKGRQESMREAQRGRSASRRSMGQMILEQDGQKTVSRPGSKAGISKPGSAKTRRAEPMFLDAQQALSLQPQTLQGVGASIITPGVDPRIKYRHPQTSQQTVGWNNKSLEFFGVAQHGRQSHTLKAQFDE